MSDEEMDDQLEEDFEENEDEHLYPFQRIGPRTGHISFKYGRHVVVWGGYIFDKYVNDTRFHSTTHLWTYDPVVDKWNCRRTSDANAPPGRAGASGLLHNDTLYIFGGYTSRKTEILRKSNEIYSLNLIDLIWTKHESDGIKPLPCDKMVGWVYQDKLYYFGGFGLACSSGACSPKLFDFCYDDTVPGMSKGWNNQLVEYHINSKQWRWPKCKGQPPEPRAAHACTRIGSKVYIFGGRHLESRLNDLHCLDLETMTWSGKLLTRGDIPTGRSWHTLTQVSESCVVLYGGLSNQREALSDCWLLNLTDLSWERIALPFVKSRVWHTACEGDPGEVIIFGGCSGNILNPRPPEAEGIINLWFSPKSLLRLCLDAIVNNKPYLEPYCLMLPSTLADILRVKSTNVEHVCDNFYTNDVSM